MQLRMVRVLTASLKEQESQDVQVEMATEFLSFFIVYSRPLKHCLEVYFPFSDSG